MSFNVKVISTLNDKNAHEFSMFCDLCVTRMVRFRLKSFSCCEFSLNTIHEQATIILQVNVEMAVAGVLQTSNEDETEGLAETFNG